LTSPLTVVFAKEAYERSGGLKPAPPIGTGPFIVKDYKPQASITLDKNPKYFLQGKPYLDGVDGVILPDRASYIAAFRTNQLDFPTDWRSRQYLPRDDEFGPWYQYNPGEAKKLLDAAGMTGQSFKIQGPGTSLPSNDLAALALQNWKAVGLNPTWEPLDAVA